MSAHVDLAELTRLSCARELSPAESDALFNAHVREDLRQRRLPERIMRLRAELHRAESDLWPCYVKRLRDLEEAHAAALIDALEEELAR